MRPYCTLLLLQSLDGKISTGVGKELDFDRDLPKFKSVKKGLWRYYDAESESDHWSMLSPGTLAKLGANEGEFIKEYHKCGHIILDGALLTKRGLEHICQKCDEVVFISKDGDKVPHCDNIHWIDANPHNEAAKYMESLYNLFGIERITVQTGGTTTASLLLQSVIDEISLFIAPILVGGTETPSTVMGESIYSPDYLYRLTTLELNHVITYPEGIVKMSYKVNRKEPLI